MTISVGYQADEFPGVKKVHQQSVSGPYRRIKSAILIALGIGFYGLAWLPWDRPGDTPDQAFLMSFTEGKFYTLGMTFWPQDMFLLTLVLLFSAFGLFFTNTIVGRVWCGFTCPQTLWTDGFMMIERLFEGDRNQQLKRVKEGLTAENLARKIGKHSTWVIIGLLTGLTLISYFAGTVNTFVGVATLSASVPVLVMVLVFTVLTYLLAGFAREKVCLYMCPWPRFQSAMLDPDTKIVTYHAFRGEPRGKPKKNAADTALLGDCVDCNLCVNVCPTGVDIRNGLQLGCIGCGLCADACDGIMAKLNRPLGLINFASLSQTHDEAHLAAPLVEVSGKKRKSTKVRFFGYGILMMLVGAAMVGTLLTRTGFDVAVTPERNPPFVLLSDGSVRNIYTVRLSDRSAEVNAVRFELEGVEQPSLTISLAGRELAEGASPTIDFSQTEAASLRVLVTVPPARLPEGRTAIRLSFIDHATGEVMTFADTYFWGPENGR
ncbi:MAG: cytochrome c oxidase accessory protein CcoG [Pseudomonadota bacterium]